MPVSDYGAHRSSFRSTGDSGVSHGVNWDRLLAEIHPIQIMILAAVDWIREPLSPSLLTEVFDSTIPLAQLSYHVKRLGELDVLEVVEEEQVRGALAKYWVPATTIRSTAIHDPPGVPR